MSILICLSIAIRVLNFFWSIALVRRVRDWRLSFLPLMMILTVMRQTIDLFEDGVAWKVSWSMPLSEVPGLLLSGITFLLIFVLERIFKERDEAKEALEASRAKYYTVFRSSPDAIVITAKADSALLEVNEGFSRFFGISREEAVGHTSAELGMWTDRNDRLRALEVLARDGKVRDFETRFETRTGDGSSSRTVPCSISIEAIEIEGKPHTLTVIRDISGSKQVEAEREAFVEQLETKNAELERFTYTVSHDLKSPLVTIRGFVGLLERDIASGKQDRIQRDIERIDNAAATMGRLLDELLELSRIGRVTQPPTEAALTTLVKEAAELVAGHLAERNIELEIAEGLPLVTGDQPRLVEVFQNLLENAIKFMGEHPHPKIEIGIGESRGETACFVRDNGAGIESRYHEKIFGLFNRLDQSVEGTGIGLALVKRIVEVHGGKIWVESAGAGAGSTFWLTLPGIGRKGRAAPLG
ncbi:MAG: ATP-binding protein [Acidobacteriota bacterium]